MINGLGAGFRFFSQPTNFLRLQRVLLVLLCLWVGISLWRALWSFFPEAQPLPPAAIMNPVSTGSAAKARVSVDIDALALANFFGEPGAPVSPETLVEATGRAPAMSESEASVALAGIEDGAPETRLPLVLRGVLAASEAGLGQAVIELRNSQDLYQVGDEIPVSGEVVLAKVLSNLIVLDNGGRYEILRLFDEGQLVVPLTRLDAQPSTLGPAVMAPVDEVSTTASAEGRGSSPAAADLGAQYRERLYRDPQSLAEVVRVEAVREGTQLQGYRIHPGKAAQEFSALGFESGDLVTAINGLSLTDPANTMRLYQAMRSASEASFELQRKGESVTLNVNLTAATAEGDS